jgi:hypothetical protein
MDDHDYHKCPSWLMYLKHYMNVRTMNHFDYSLKVAKRNSYTISIHDWGIQNTIRTLRTSMWWWFRLFNGWSLLPHVLKDARKPVPWRKISSSNLEEKADTSNRYHRYHTINVNLYMRIMTIIRIPIVLPLDVGWHSKQQLRKGCQLLVVRKSSDQ